MQNRMELNKKVQTESEIKNYKPLTVSQMQEMYDRYDIKQFNEDTKEIERATTHTVTTAELLTIIKYYEDKEIEEK